MPDTSSHLLQDKENRQTPSTAYISSRLGLTSPAFHTPSHAGAAHHEDPAASDPKPSRDSVHAADTLATGTISSHTLPLAFDKDHGTPNSAAASAGAAAAPAEESAAPAEEAALPVGACGDMRFSSPKGPTQRYAQQGDLHNFAKEQQATGLQARVSPCG